MVFGTLPFDDQRAKRQIAQIHSAEFPKYQSIRPRKEEVSRSNSRCSTTSKLSTQCTTTWLCLGLIELLQEILVVSSIERPTVSTLEQSTWLQKACVRRNTRSIQTVRTVIPCSSAAFAGYCYVKIISSRFWPASCIFSVFESWQTPCEKTCWFFDGCCFHRVSAAHKNHSDLPKQSSSSPRSTAKA